MRLLIMIGVPLTLVVLALFFLYTALKAGNLIGG